MDEEKIAAAFTEWARQYQEDPSAFDADAINGDVGDYGHRCARTLIRLMEEAAAK